MAASIPLNVVISATDDASSVVSGFGTSLDNAKTSILAVGAAAAAVFAAVSSEITAATDAAAEQQNTQAQLAAVIKSTGGASGETADSIDELAESLQKSSGYSADQIEQVDTMLIGMKTLGSDVIPGATQAILDFAARTGTDAVSAAQVLGKALGDPALAIGALTREHIILTAAQQDNIKAMVAVGDTAGAQKAIIDAMNETVGGAAEQTDTLTYQQRLLNSEMESMQESVGNALIPVMAALLSKLEPIIEAVVQWTTAHPKLTAALLGGIAAVSGLTVVVTALAGAVLLFSAVSLPVVGIILAIVAVIAILAIAAYEIVANWGTITAFFQTLWNDVAAAFNTGLSFIENLVTTVFTGIQTTLTTIGNAIQAVFWAYVDFMLGAWKMLLDFLFPGWEAALVGIYNTAVQYLTEVFNFLQTMFGEIVSYLQTTLDTITTAWEKMWQGVEDFFTTIWDSIKSIAQGAFDTISAGISALTAPLQGLINLAQQAASIAGSVLGAAGSVVSHVAGIGASITGHAAGGSVSPGQTYLVGEQGPELFSSGSAGFITPNHALAGAGGINISITGTFMSEGAAVQMANKVVDVLKRRTRIGV
jgi:hypothetical protein